MAEEKKKEPKVTVTTSNIADPQWITDKRQIREVKLAAEEDKKKKKE